MKNTKFKYLPGDEVWFIIDIEQDSFEIGHGRIFSCTTMGNMPDNRIYRVFFLNRRDFDLDERGPIDLEECEVFDTPNEAVDYCLKGMKEFDEDIKEEKALLEHPF